MAGVWCSVWCSGRKTVAGMLVASRWHGRWRWTWRDLRIHVASYQRIHFPDKVTVICWGAVSYHAKVV